MHLGKVKLLLLFLAVGFSLCSIAIVSNALKPMNQLPYRMGYILVKTIDNAPIEVINQTAFSLGAIPIKSFSLVPGLALFEYNQAIDIQDVVEVFLENDLVEYAEPDYLYHAALQNDPRFPEQWALENNGQTGGTIDADINAVSMWNIEDGDPTVVIGITDSGIDFNHRDLIANLWSNVLEIPGNGIDDDLNGFIDDKFGINAILNNGSPLDDNAHGTHVSGTIGADGNNALGVVGIAQNVMIASCKFLGSTGMGYTSDAIQCLQYFANLKTRPVNPVNIVATNNSWVGPSYSLALRDAILSHQNLGILFVAAAGNDSADSDQTPHYPASYDLSNIISVAATDHNDGLASFSNYGRRTVHVAAPGVRILSTVPNQSYALFSGTSMATPHVTGLVAITKSNFPSFDYRQIKNVVLASGTFKASLQNKTITGRRIRGADTNGTGALTCVNQQLSSRLRPIENSVAITLGGKIFLSALRLNCSSPGGTLVLYKDASESVALQDNGTNGDLVANDGIYSLLWSPSSAKTYTLNYGTNDTVAVIVSPIAAPLEYKVYTANFEYENIVGTSLGMGDESIQTVNLSFPIHFDGNAQGYSTLYVSSNGTLSFTTNANPGYLNRSLPTTIASTLVAPYWDDLVPNGANSNVYVAITGNAPNRHVVIEWRNMKQFNSSGLGTFQVILYENSADIRFNYLDTNFSSTDSSFGASATIGVQLSTMAAKQYSYNTATVTSPLSLLFRLE